MACYGTNTPSLAAKLALAVDGNVVERSATGDGYWRPPLWSNSCTMVGRVGGVVVEATLRSVP